MIELDIEHKRGKRTFFYIFLCFGWWLALIGIGLFYLTWLIYFGRLRDNTENFLNLHSNWYITVPMLSEWLILLAISFLIIAYLRVNVLYRNYKFILDDYAVHLHRGLFFRRETTIPYQQISNVKIDRPFHYKLFGVSQIDIVTAADRNNTERKEKSAKEFYIPVIDTKLARQLARQLLESASKSRRREHEDIIEDSKLQNSKEIIDIIENED